MYYFTEGPRREAYMAESDKIIQHIFDTFGDVLSGIKCFKVPLHYRLKIT